MGLKRAPGMVVATVLAAGVVAGCSAGPTAQAIPTLSASPKANANPIVSENKNPGTSGWNAPRNDRITGYADAASVNLGETVQFAVSTKSPTFDLEIYRLG